MSESRIYPLSEQVPTTLKKTRRDQFGNGPKIEQAQSRRSICRRCLRRFNPGERRLLFKYRPFEKEGVFAEAGAIYIHESDCRPEKEILPINVGCRRLSARSWLGRKHARQRS